MAPPCTNHGVSVRCLTKLPLNLYKKLCWKMVLENESWVGSGCSHMCFPCLAFYGSITFIPTCGSLARLESIASTGFNSASKKGIIPSDYLQLSCFIPSICCKSSIESTSRGPVAVWQTGHLRPH